MKSKDLIDFQQGIYDLTKELATDKILFYPLDPTVKPNIYGENKDKKYLDPIPLVGSIKTSSERKSIDGSTSLDLKEVEITFPALSLELNNITAKDLDKGKIQVKDLMYNVTTVVASDMFLGDYCSYICYCKEFM